MRRIALVSLLVALLAPLTMPSQQSDAAQAPATSKNTPLLLREGTEVALKFAEALNSKTAKTDDSVNLVLAEDIKVGDVVVVRAGAKGLATVSNAKKAGMMGKGGELNIRLESLRAGDVKIHLRGSKARQGDDKVGTAVALTVLFGPVGLLKHGKNIDIKEGTEFKAYVADDITLPPAN